MLLWESQVRHVNMIVGNAKHKYRVVTGYSFAEDAHGCYDRQMEAVERYGQSAPLYYWYPRCLPGGYFQVCGISWLVVTSPGAVYPDTYDDAVCDLQQPLQRWNVVILQNVQCNAFDGCHCSYIDTGEKIPGTLSNLFLRFMRENCPLMPEKKPSPCMEPRKQYPCKSRSSRYASCKITLSIVWMRCCIGRHRQCTTA